MEKPGIEPATPGLQGKKRFCGFPWYKPEPAGWFKICVGFITGTPEGSTESGFMEKPEIEPATTGSQGKKPFGGFPGYKPVPPGWFKICVGFITGTPKGSPKVVLWRSQESNLRPLVYKALFFCFPGYKPVPPGWFKICVGFITRTPKGSPKVVLWRSRESNLRPLVYKGKNFFVAFLDINQFHRVGLRFVLVLYRELLKAQPKLVLWRSRESNLRPLVYKGKNFLWLSWI